MTDATIKCVAPTIRAYSLLHGFAMAFLAGISIEIVQCIQGSVNTNRESIMDALTTTLCFLYPMVKR